MDNLPLELYLEIFKYLKINDLLNCQLISKKFVFVVQQQMNIKELNVDNYDKNGNEDSVISTRIFERLRKFNLEKSLKCLSLNCKINLHFTILNRLKGLIDLNFKYSYRLKLNNQTLELPKLRKFKITDAGNFKLILKTEKLEFIHFNDCFFYEIQVKLGYLNVKEIKSSLYDKSMIIFKNLQFLELRSLEGLDVDVLKIFRNLKRIIISFNILEFDEDDDTLFEDKIKIQQILNQQNELNRSNFEFHYENILIKSTANTNYLDILYERNYYNYPDYDLSFHIQNLDLLISNHSNLTKYTNFINYNDLAQLSTDEQLVFFNKFTKIQSVKVFSKVIDSDHFLWFLSKLTELNTLKLVNTELDQKFYDKLPLSAIKLNEFELKNFEHLKLINNFDFLIKFTQLTLFTTDYSIPILVDLVRKMTNARKFEINFRNDNLCFRTKMSKRNNKFNVSIFKLDDEDSDEDKSILDFENLEPNELPIIFLNAKSINN